MSSIPSNSLYTDFNSLSLLRKDAEVNPNSDATLREVAQQFESLFLHMMLKSMRSAVPESDLMSSQQTGFYQEMLDQQLSTELPKQGGIGLADIIVQQLGGNQENNRLDEKDSLDEGLSFIKHKTDSVASRDQFVAELLPAVNNASQELGVERDAILAQAILETGWGQSIIHDNQGRNSHNLFGIKADDRWQGDKITTRTYEFIDGALQARYEDFRAYASYQESIEDYVSFLSSNPRYQEAVESGRDAGTFAEKIQQAGYATDPEYAQKVKDIIAGNTFQSLVANAAVGDS